MLQSGSPYLLTLPQAISAKKKIGNIASVYDPLKSSFGGFERHALDPTEFREQLKATFQLSLTDAELGALVIMCDKDNNRSVDSAEFINEFFRLGKLEKQKFFFKHKDERQRLQNVQMKYDKDQRDKVDALLRYKIPKTWSKETEDRAMDKIRQAAYFHKPNSGLVNSLKGFVDGGEMTPVQFKEQLRRSFELNLAPSEVAALMKNFDTDKGGTVDCNEFLFHFFKSSRQEREAHLKKAEEVANRKRQAEKRRVDSHLRECELKNTTKIKPEPSDGDRESAWELIKEAAISYDCNSDWNFTAFECISLSPTQFREQMRNIFLISFTPGQLAACLEEFGNGEGGIDCKLFLSKFYRLGIHEKHIRRRERARHGAILQKIKKKFDEDLDKKAAIRRETGIIWPYVEQSLEGDSSALLEDSLANSASTRLRPLKKPGVLDILHPNKDLLTTLLDERSFVDLFPNASQGTKDFIREIEKQEEEVTNMKKSSKSKKK